MNHRIVLKKINKEVIKPIKIDLPEDNRPILGESLFSEIFANIALIAKKKSGKTTALNHILKRCAGKDTTVIFFCSTIYKDKNYVGIRKMLEKKGIDYEVHTSLKEDGEDQLDLLISELTEEAKQREEEQKNAGQKDDEPKYTNNDILNELSKEGGFHHYLNKMDEQEEKKPRKSKYRMPEYIIVLDDLSNQLKSTSLETLLKKNRHFFSKVIMSTQYIHDLAPESLKQLDYWLIYRGQPKDKLQKIYKDADLSIDFDLFEALYKDSTNDKFGFLYIDTNNMEFRKGFNRLYMIDGNN